MPDPGDSLIGLAAVEAAAAAIAGQVVATPCVAAPGLSGPTGADLVLKLENLQVTGSFKARGALNRLLALDDAGRRAGVVAMSAGNHAQGLAHHARRLGIPATVVMPRDTAFTKVGRTEALGARVVLHGATLAESEAHARALAAASGATLVHPYDDALVIAGQGTVGLEMMRQCPDLDAVIVPCGGGGLIAGMAAAIKALRPATEVVGVQVEGYAGMLAALRKGAAQPAAQPGATLADGIAVKTPGAITSAMVTRSVDDLVVVGESLLEAAVLRLAEAQKVVAEGAGAAPLAALLAEPERWRGRRVGLVVSGGNIDARLLAGILLRGLSRAGRMARLRIALPDLPGVLARVAGLIGDAGANIIEVTHQRLFHDIPLRSAELDVVVETVDADHVGRLVATLAAAGYPTRIMANTAEG